MVSPKPEYIEPNLDRQTFSLLTRQSSVNSFTEGLSNRRWEGVPNLSVCSRLPPAKPPCIIEPLQAGGHSDRKTGQSSSREIAAWRFIGNSVSIYSQRYPLSFRTSWPKIRSSMLLRASNK